MAENNKNKLINILAREMAEGKLKPEDVLPVIKELSKDTEETPSSSVLLEELRAHTGENFVKLISSINTSRRGDMLRLYWLKRTYGGIPEEHKILLGDFPDIKQGWGKDTESTVQLLRLLQVYKDIFYLEEYSEVKMINQVVEAEYQRKINTLAIMQEISSLITMTLVNSLEGKFEGKDIQALKDAVESDVKRRTEEVEKALDKLPAPLPKDLDKTILISELQSRIQSSEGVKEKYLDVLCSLPGKEAIPAILESITEPLGKERASLLLTLRFGGTGILNWKWWQDSLNYQKQHSDEIIKNRSMIVSVYAPELLLLWYSQREDADEEIILVLKSICKENGKNVTVNSFVNRWAKHLSTADRNILLGKGSELFVPPPPPVPKTAAAIAAAQAKVKAEGVITAITPIAAETKIEEVKPQKVEEKAPVVQEPSLWDSHIQPFISENWYMVAGIMMVIVGSSVLAYFTWGSHWLLRYTLMPILLGAFTGSLGYCGSWIDKKGDQFKGMAAMLRGAAIGLLPINFMAIALLANDTGVSYTHRLIAVPAMGLIYIILAGWGLKSWCAAVHKPLGWLMGGTLLFLNGQVTLGPLAKAVVRLDTKSIDFILGTGFYLGFFALSIAVLRFVRNILTKDIAKEQRVSWFFGAGIIITFLQVFAWVHGFTNAMPEVYTYAPMAIMAGWLILQVEKRSLQLRDEATLHAVESFLGYAFIFLGILMGASEGYVRIICFLLAGAVWMSQAVSRKHPLHYWISLTLLALGGASVGLLTGFPSVMLPVLGIAIAISMGICGKFADIELKKAGIGMQVAVLLISSVVAILTQWHFQGMDTTELLASYRFTYLLPESMFDSLVMQPYKVKVLPTAIYLLIISALFTWRAFHDNHLKWLHAAMILLALTLPYLGCVDMLGQSLRGNTMVFGLGVLAFAWLILTKLKKSPLILEARSTVLFFYGGIAVAAMILRVLFERGLSDDIWIRTLDYSGPMLITVALIFATYYSRSLIPAIMATIVMVILFPGLKAGFKHEFETMGWGSGLGSACSSLALIGFCFWLRNAKFLKKLGEGDKFMGKMLFPIRRYDHTLFSWPIVASVLFLITKTETWILWRNIIGSGVHFKTSLAILLTGVSWMSFGFYTRKNTFSSIAVYVGWFWIAIGIGFGYCHFVHENRIWSEPVLIGGLLMQACYFVVNSKLKSNYPWLEKLMTLPTYYILHYGSMILAVLTTMSVIIGMEPTDVAPLMVFVALQLIWYGLYTKNYVFGTELFFMLWTVIIALSNPGEGSLLRRITLDGLTPTLILLLLPIQVVHIVFEFKKDIYSKLKPLLLPFMAAASSLAVIAILAAFIHAPFEIEGFTLTQQLLLLGVVFLTARAHSCNILVLLGISFAYVLLRLGQFDTLDTPGSRMIALLSHLHTAYAALVIVLLGHIGRLLHREYPNLLSGSFKLRFFRAQSINWLYAPALFITCFAAIRYSASSLTRNNEIQLLTPYISALTTGLLAWSWKIKYLYALVMVFLGMGNIQLVRLYFKDFLVSKGLSQVHIFCLGLALTLIQSTAVSKILRRKNVSTSLNRASLVFAALILSLLSANYFVNPNLAEITWQRYMISGIMALLSGLYFRRAARYPGHGEEQFTDLLEGIYHFGITMAIWCMFLMIPWFRNPATALIALGVPALYFYVHAEIGSQLGISAFVMYRRSATLLGFVILALYIFRGAFQMVLFPDVPVLTDYYHYNAPFIMVLALVMFRLHGLGGTAWLIIYGGLAMITGSYFTLTFLPKMSPFDYPINAAWCAIALSHFWILVSNEKSPLRSFIQQIAVIGDEKWYQDRRVWGIFVLITTHISMIWAIINYKDNSFMIAPLLLGTASILIHQGVIRKSKLYLGIAIVEILAALHADFLLESYLAKDHIIWVILGLWVVALIAHYYISLSHKVKRFKLAAAGFTAITFIHVMYHYPYTTVGLWGFALMVVLAALTPMPSRHPQDMQETFFSGAFFWVPTWLVFFGKMPFDETGVQPLDYTYPILITIGTMFLSGCFVRYYQLRLAEKYNNIKRLEPRMFDLSLSQFGKSGVNINTVALWLTFTATAILQVWHYSTPYSNNEILLITGIYALSTIAWYFEGKLRRNISSYFVMQLCALGFFAVIRSQLKLTTEFWIHEYDVWASLVISFALAATKKYLDVRPRELRIPMLSTLCALPVIAMIWVLWHRLGSDIAMVVVGLHSLMFTYIGKDDKESPYNIVAVGGFVTFVLIFFWTKLELRVIHAYTIPAGVGVLLLLQLFRDRTEPVTRNKVRLATLLVMIGSAGYYALIDDKYPISHIMVFGLLCILSMGLGSFLRIRLYLILGFGGLIVDLCAIVYKVIVAMEQRSAKMTIIGSLVLIAGAALVAGAVYYKTHQDKINEFLDKWRKKLGEWE